MCGLPDKRLTSRLLAEALRVFTGSTLRPDIGKQYSLEAAAQLCIFTFSGDFVAPFGRQLRGI
jgi:hypothetical protein